MFIYVFHFPQQAFPQHVAIWDLKVPLYGLPEVGAFRLHVVGVRGNLVRNCGKLTEHIKI